LKGNWLYFVKKQRGIMAAEHLKRATPEELAAMREAGRIARAEKAAFNKANEHLYKLDYMDSNHWQELASKHKIRMPVYNEPATAKGIRKYMRKVGIDNDTWKDHYTSVEYFVNNNPKWTLYGAVGLMLELREGM
jgi:hypothetical protein